MKDENEKKSTITFGELLEIMQEKSDREAEKRGLPKRKIEPLIGYLPSEEHQTRVTMKSGILKHTNEEREERIYFRITKEEQTKERIKLFLGAILILGFILVQFRVYKLFIN